MSRKTSWGRYRVGSGLYADVKDLKTSCYKSGGVHVNYFVNRLQYMGDIGIERGQLTTKSLTCANCPKSGVEFNDVKYRR
jgi:hypothetical protein